MWPYVLVFVGAGKSGKWGNTYHDTNTTTYFHSNFGMLINKDGIGTVT